MVAASVNRFQFVQYFVCFGAEYSKLKSRSVILIWASTMSGIHLLLAVYLDYQRETLVGLSLIEGPSCQCIPR